MTITCPNCETHNKMPDIPNPNKTYRCGKCRTILISPQPSKDEFTERLKVWAAVVLPFVAGIHSISYLGWWGLPAFWIGGGIAMRLLVKLSGRLEGRF